MIVQADLFGMAIEPNRIESRSSYHELGIYDVDKLGCSECDYCDWNAERCRLTKKAVNADFGTCSEIKMKWTTAHVRR